MSEKDLELEKQKAIAAAKAKAAAAAAAKAKAMEGANETSAPASTPSSASPEDEKAKAIAAAKAKAAAAAAARTASATTEEKPVDLGPSPNQPFLDKYVAAIESKFGSQVIEEKYINRLSKHVPTIQLHKNSYFKVMQFLKEDSTLHFEYVSNLHGTDYQTHLEVYVFLYSYKNTQSVVIKVKVDRDNATIDSITPIWQGANWPECEAYDLLGIHFKGHPNLHRIMLGEKWVGYPLRKDYEPFDVEV